MLWGKAKRQEEALNRARQKQEEALDRARQEIRALVTEHVGTLGRRRMLLIKVDPYGVVDAKAWNTECQHFWDKVIRPRLTDDEALAVMAVGLNRIATEMIEGPARLECARLEASSTYNDEMSPIEYERFCASRLEANGWVVELTKMSGDQGVDILARRRARLLVIQCKKYSTPVGNGAVQEVIAAKAYLRADFAAVVTNASFTTSAVALATSTRTLLLHHTELDDIERKLDAL